MVHIAVTVIKDNGTTSPLVSRQVDVYHKPPGHFIPKKHFHINLMLLHITVVGVGPTCLVLMELL